MIENKIINVVIADDNRFFCEVLKDSLDAHKKIDVVKISTTLIDIIEYSKNNIFDVLILDLSFNGESSLDYIKEIKNDKNFKIIILTTLNNSVFKNRALKNKGINAFVGKDSKLIKFKEIIIDTFYDKLEKESIKKTKLAVDNTKFTKRKIDVLQLLYKFSDLRETELSKKLNVSVSCLKTHKRELFKLTSTKNAQELVKFGIKKEIIMP